MIFITLFSEILYLCFITSRQYLVVNDKDFCFLSFFSIIIIFYRIEAGSWFKPNSLSPGGGFLLCLTVEALTVFRLALFSIFSLFQRKFIFNWISGSSITTPHLIKSWYIYTSAIAYSTIDLNWYVSPQLRWYLTPPVFPKLFGMRAFY